MVSANDNLHSRLVGWAKIILPLCALALLSTLFLFARGTNDPTDIPLAEIDALAREQRITAPSFSGVASDGSLITVKAQSAQPDSGSPGELTITSPRLTLDASDGTSLTIVAGEGALSTSANTARLSGLARLETSSGYLMETTELSADLSSGLIQSLGPLAIKAPFGEITAGMVSISVGKDNSGQQMHFTQGVNMIYDPTSHSR